jgi:hypothetical protein
MAGRLDARGDRIKDRWDDRQDRRGAGIERRRDRRR